MIREDKMNQLSSKLGWAEPVGADISYFSSLQFLDSKRQLVYPQTNLNVMCCKWYPQADVTKLTGKEEQVRANSF